MSLSCYLLCQITLGSPTKIFSFLHELSEVRIFRYFSASDSSSKKRKGEIQKWVRCLSKEFILDDWFNYLHRSWLMMNFSQCLQEGRACELDQWLCGIPGSLSIAAIRFAPQFLNWMKKGVCLTNTQSRYVSCLWLSPETFAHCGLYGVLVSLVAPEATCKVRLRDLEKRQEALQGYRTDEGVEG